MLTCIVLEIVCCWEIAEAGKLEEQFRAFDANNDGKVTAAELGQPELFKRLDTNQDGFILLDEARQAISNGAFKQTETAVEEKAAQASTDEKEIRQGPTVLKPGDHGIGGYVADLEFQDVAGKNWKLSQLAQQNKLLVLAMTSTSCPISKKYLPTLQMLTKTYQDRDVCFVLVNPIGSDDKQDMLQIQQEFGNRATYVFDRDEKIALAVKASSTTDVVVVNPSRTVVYHGAIDDQYGFGYAIEKPRHKYLIAALESLLAGRTPAVTATDAPGCALGLEHRKIAPSSITYHNRVSRLMQRHCVECHRDGGVGPFPLTTYKEVTSHAGMIQQVVERGVMSPWFAAKSEKQSHSIWANDRSLSKNEINDLLQWISSGKPQGDQADAPTPRQFYDGWLIGKPDAIYEMPEAIAVKASGIMPYKYATIETNIKEDTWIQAIEVQPGQRDVVHHILVFDVPPDLKSRVNGREGFFGAYVPGNSTQIFPEGYARLLKAGWRLRFQLHYTPVGRATEDRSRIGFVFARQPPEHQVHVTGLSNTRIAIPAYSDNHAETAQLRLPTDIEVLSLLPHMHLRGKACRYEWITASGEQKILLDVPRYDFNWQLPYQFAQPQRLAADDIIKFTGWYDNSANNPANPDPSQVVRWGDQTDEEMLLGYVQYIVPSAKPGESHNIPRRPRRENLEQIFQRLDRDKNGLLSREELPAKLLFDRLDRNKDDQVSLEEAKQINR